MAMRSNVHTHSTWCDGESTTRQVAEAALALGFTDLGFSSHGPAPFDPACPGIADEAAYRAGIAALKAEYAGRLGILCGVEQDAVAPVDKAAYDYIIGSVHYLPGPDGRFWTIDSSAKQLLAMRDELFGGEWGPLFCAYFGLVANITRQTRPDIVGHFDLVSKFNGDGGLFDEESAEYRRPALEALDAVIDTLAGYGGMVEVNTGAMGRGLRPVPYPSPFLLRHLAQRGARVIITTDSHHCDTLAAGYEAAVAQLRQAGFAQMWVLSGGAFVPQAL